MPLALLVDADPIQGEVAALVCHGLGFRAVFAATLAGAMTIAAREELAFAIIDLLLPDAAGAAAVAALARAARGPLPIVAVSHKDVGRDARAIHEAGAAAIVQKPYLGRSLREAISQALLGPPPPSGLGHLLAPS